MQSTIAFISTVKYPTYYFNRAIGCRMYLFYLLFSSGEKLEANWVVYCRFITAGVGVVASGLQWHADGWSWVLTQRQHSAADTASPIECRKLLEKCFV